MVRAPQRESMPALIRVKRHSCLFEIFRVSCFCVLSSCSCHSRHREKSNETYEKKQSNACKALCAKSPITTISPSLLNQPARVRFPSVTLFESRPGTSTEGVLSLFSPVACKYPSIVLFANPPPSKQAAPCFANESPNRKRAPPPVLVYFSRPVSPTIHGTRGLRHERARGGAVVLPVRREFLGELVVPGEAVDP